MGKSSSIIRRDKKVMSTSYDRDYPFAFKKGAGCYMWDTEGKKYLDFAAGIAVLGSGHSNPSIVSAVKKQLRYGTHCAFPDFYSELPVAFSETLLRQMPSPLNKGRVFLSNSGTESVEAALKLAKWKTRRRYVIAFRHCFHGRTMGSLSMTNSKPIQRKGFAPFLPVKHVPFPYAYQMKMEPEECGDHCLNKLEKTMKQLDGNCAALFMEPIQGEGGYIVPPKSFVKGVRKLCNSFDVLLCDDEVQSGCWRTGKFLAVENFGVTPDIVSLAKAVGGGLPLGATIAKPGIMEWPKGSHSNTFGGNLLACAAGRASLDFMKKRRLGENAVRRGKEMTKRLDEMKEKYEIIGDVRGIGLMIGVEIVKSKRSRAPDAEARDSILRKASENGLVLLGAGKSVIRICPPLIIAREQAEKGLDILENAIKVINNGRS